MAASFLEETPRTKTGIGARMRLLKNIQRADRASAMVVGVLPILWWLLWLYQAVASVPNDTFLAESASFVFAILMPVMYLIHRHTIMTVYARHQLREFKQRIAQHRATFFGLSLVSPLVVFSVYWSDIFRHGTEQNIVYGAMLVLDIAMIQLTTINWFSLLMMTRRKQDPVPHVLVTLLAYPVIAIPLFQSLIYFVLVGA